MFWKYNINEQDFIIYLKILIIPAILNLRLEFEIPFELVLNGVASSHVWHTYNRLEFLAVALAVLIKNLPISNLEDEEDPNEHCLNYHKRDESEGSGSEGPDSEKCHHDHFPKETIQQKLGDEDVKTCCKDYGYIFKDNCKWPVRRVSISLFNPLAPFINNKNCSFKGHPT